MVSGVTVSDACKTVCEKIKTKKDFRYFVFFIKDETFIDVEATGNRDSSYEEFLEHMKIVGTNGEKECRYGLFDFEYTHQCQGCLIWYTDSLSFNFSASFDVSLDIKHRTHALKNQQFTQNTAAIFDFLQT